MTKKKYEKPAVTKSGVLSAVTAQVSSGNA